MTSNQCLTPIRPPVGWGNADSKLRNAWRAWCDRLKRQQQEEEWAATFEEYH